MFKKSLLSAVPSAILGFIGWILIDFLFGVQTAINSIFTPLAFVFLNFALAYVFLKANEFWKAKKIEEEEEKNTD